MKSVRFKILSVVLIALLAIVACFAGTQFMGGGITVSAETRTQTVSDENDGISAHAAAVRKEPVFSYKGAGDTAYTTVAAGGTAFVKYDHYTAHEFKFTNYDESVVSYKTTGSGWATPVTVDTTNKTLTLYLSARAAVGNYTVEFSLKDTTDTWDGSKNAEPITFNITVDKKQIEVPEFYRQNADGTKGAKVATPADTREYSVTPYKYRVYNYDSNYITFSKQASVSFGEQTDEDGKKYQLVQFPVVDAGTAAATYWFRATIDTAKLAWKDGTSAASIDYGVNVTKLSVEAPAIASIDGKANTDTDLRTTGFTYDGKAHTVVLEPTHSGIFNIPSVSGMGASFDDTTGALTLTVTNAGNYSFTLSLKNTTNFQWAGGGTANNTYTISVAPKALDESTIKLNTACDSSYDTTTSNKTISFKNDSPTLAEYSLEYDAGVYYYFTLSGLTGVMFSASDMTNTAFLNVPAKVSGSSYSGNNTGFDDNNNRYRFYLNMQNDDRSNPVGEHYFYLTPTANYTWKDGSADKRKVSIIVKKKKLELPKFVSGSAPTKGEIASDNGVLTENGTHITYYYTGSAINAYLNEYPSNARAEYKATCETGLSAGTGTYSGANRYRLYATNIGLYKVTYTHTRPAFYEWADAETDDGQRGIVLKFEIVAHEIKGNAFELYSYGTDSTRDSKSETKLTLDKNDAGNLYYSLEWQPNVYYYTLKGLYSSEVSSVTPSATSSGTIQNYGFATTTVDYNFTIGSSVAVNEAAYGYSLAIVLKDGYSWDSVGTTGTRYVYIKIKNHTITGVNGDLSDGIHNIYQLADSNYEWIAKNKPLVTSTSANPTANLGYTLTVPFSTEARYYAIADFLAPMVTVTSNVTGKIPSPTTFGTANDEVNGYIKFYIAANAVAGEVILTVTPKDQYAWPGAGKEARTVTIIIEKTELKVPTVKNASGANINDSSVANQVTVAYTYNGTEQGFTLDNYVTGLTVSTSTGFTTATADATANTYTFKAKNAGTYTVTVNIDGGVNSTKYSWDDGSGAITKTYILKINKKAINSVDHTLNLYGQGPGVALSDFNACTTAVDKYTGKMDESFFITLDLDVNLAFNRFYLMSITGLRDNTLGENLFSSFSIVSTSYNNTYYLTASPGMDNATGNFYFYFDTYYSASWGAVYAQTDHAYTITPNTNYCWDDPTESVSARTFYIKCQKRNIEVPKANDNADDDGYDADNRILTVPYTGSAQHFKLYGDFNRINSYPVSSGATVVLDTDKKFVDFYATNAGTYTITFGFSGNGYAWHYQWADHASDVSATRVVTLVIERKEIDIPELRYTGRACGVDKETKLNDVTYSGRTVTLTYDSTARHDVDSYAWFTLFGCDGVTNTYTTYSGLDFVGYGYNALSGTNYSWGISQRDNAVRTGTQTVTITPTANYRWKGMGGSATLGLTYTIVINSLKIAVPEFKDFDSIACTNNKTSINVEYDGVAHTAVIPDITDAFLSLGSGSQGGWNATKKTYDIAATNAGSYTVTFVLRQPANTVWDDGVNVTSNRAYTYTIDRKKVGVPDIKYYGSDSSCTSSPLKTSSTGSMSVSFDPNVSDYYYYFALDNGGQVTSTIFTETRENSTYQGATWDTTNFRYIFSMNKYSTPFVRAEGWKFTLTPTVNYRWDTDETTAKTFTIYMTKYKYAEPEFSADESTNGAGCVYDPGTKTLTVPYTGGQQTMSFTGFFGAYMTASYPSLSMSNHDVKVVDEEGNETGDTIAYTDFRAAASNTYSITFTLKDATYCEWTGGVNPVYYLKIKNVQVAIPELYLLNGDDEPIKDNTNGDYPNYTVPLRSMTLPYKESGDYKFVMPDYFEDYYTLSLAPVSGKTMLHSAVSNSGAASGYDHQFTISQADIYAGKYTITLTLKANIEWTNGSTAAQSYVIEIMPIKVALPTLYDPATGDRITVGTNELSLTYTGAGQQFIFIPQALVSGDQIDSAFNVNNILVCTNNSHNSGTQPTVATSVTIGSDTVNGIYLTNQNITTYTYYLFLKNACYEWDLNGGAYNTSKALKVTIKGFELPKLEYYFEDQLVDPSSQTVYAPYNTQAQQLYFVLPEGYSDTLIDYYSISVYSGSIFGSGCSPKKTTYDIKDASGSSTTRPAFVVNVAASFWRPYDNYCYINVTPVTGHKWNDTLDASTYSYWFSTIKKQIKSPEYFIEVDDGMGDVKWESIASGDSRIYNGNPYRIMFKNVVSGEVTVAVNGTNLISTAASGASWLNDECIRTATNAATYVQTLTINSTYYEWIGNAGVTSLTFEFTVSPLSISEPTFEFTGDSDVSSSPIAITTGSYTTTYNTKAQYVRFTIADEDVGVFTETSFGGSNITPNIDKFKDDHYVYYYATNVGVYNIKLTPAANYCWSGGSTAAKDYTFEIKKQQLTRPTIDEDFLKNTTDFGGYTPGCITDEGRTVTLNYDAKNKDVRIAGYDDSVMYLYTRGYGNSPKIDNTNKYIAFSGCLTVHDNYYIQLYLRDTKNYEWDNGVVEVLTYKLIISRQIVSEVNLYQVSNKGTDSETESRLSNTNTFTYDVDGYHFNLYSTDSALQLVDNMDKVNVSVSGTNWSGGGITNWTRNYPGNGKAEVYLLTAGTYKITVEFKNTSYYTWEQAQNSSAIVYTIVIERIELTLPQLNVGGTVGGDSTSVVYDGNVKSLQIDNVPNGIVTQLAVSNTAFIGTFDAQKNNVIYTGVTDATPTANKYYTVTLGFSTTTPANNAARLNYIFTDDTYQHVYTLIVNPKPIDVPQIVNPDGLFDTDSGIFKDNTKTVTYTPDTAGRSILVTGFNTAEVTYSWSASNNGSIKDEKDPDSDIYTVTATARAVGTHTLTFTISSNYCWNSGSANIDTANKTFQLIINKAKLYVPYDRAVLTDNVSNPSWSTVNDKSARLTLTYNGEAQGFTVPFTDNDYYEYLYNNVTSEKSADNRYRTYTVTNWVSNPDDRYVRFQIKDPGNYEWDDGKGDSYRWIYITLLKKTVAVPRVVDKDDYWDTTSEVKHYDSIYINSGYRSGEYKSVTYNTGDRYLVLEKFDSSYAKANMQSSLKNLPLTGDDADPSKLVYYAQNVGTYYVYFTLIGSNYQWETGSTAEIYVFLTINKKPVTVPQISGGAEVSGNIKTVEYDGNVQHLVFPSWDTKEVDVYSKTSTLQTDGNGDFYATDYISDSGYVVHIKITNTANYIWADGTSDSYKTYYLIITPKPIALPTIVEEDDLATATYDHTVGAAKKTVEYTGAPITITFKTVYDIVTINTQYASGIQLNDDSLWNTDASTVVYQATNAGTYSVRFYLKSANYKWANNDRYNGYQTLTLVITSKKADVPTIVVEDLNDGGSINNNVKKVEYTGLPLTIRVNASFNDLNLTMANNPNRVTTDEDWKANGIVEFNATNVGTYTFNFTLKPHLAWSDNAASNVTKTIQLIIEPRRLNIPTIEGSASTTKTVTFLEDSKGNPVTQSMYLTDIIGVGNTAGDKVIIKNMSYTSTTNFTINYEADTERYRCSAAVVGSYRIRIALASTNYIWTNDTRSEFDYWLYIVRKPVDIPKLYEVGISKDSEGKDIEVLNAVSNNSAIYTYDSVGGVAVERKLRLTGVLNNILEATCNSVTANNGNMVLAYDAANELTNVKVSQVLHSGNGTTIDYVITVKLLNTQNYVWNDGAGGTGNKEFRIRINRKQIALPRIEGNTTTNMYYWYTEYNGANQSMTLNNVDTDLVNFVSSVPADFTCTPQDGNLLYCESVKDYGDRYVRLTIKDEHKFNYSWQVANGYDIGQKDYHLFIQTSNLIVPTVVGNDAQQYAAKDYVFQYSNVLDDYKATNPTYMKYVLSNETYMHPVWDEDSKILTVTVDHDAPIGNYYVTFQLVNSSNNRWANVGYYNWYDQSRYIYLQKAQVAIPSIVGNGTSLKKEVSYDGTNQEMILNDYLNEFYSDGKAKWMSYTLTSTLKFNGNTGVWDDDNAQMTFSAMEVGSYTVRISTNAYCTFSDGATYKDYTLQINKAVFAAPAFVDDGDGVVTNNSKTIVYDFDAHSIVMQNVFEDVNVTNKTIYWYDVTSYPTGTPDSSKLKITWDSKTNSATIVAQYMRVYTIRFGFTDKAYKNSKWSTTTAQYIDYTINIARASLTIPTIVTSNLATGESVSGVWKYTTYNGNFLTMQLKDIDSKYLQWQDITNYAGVDEDHKASFEYDADTKVLTVKAKYVRDYYIRITLKDTANSWWSNRSTGVVDFGFRVSKFIHSYPTVVSGCATSVVYTGKDVEFKIQNVVYGTDQYKVTTGSLKEVSWINGVLTLSAKDVGTYDVTVSVIDTNNSGWNYYSQLSFRFIITKKALSADVSFSSTVTEVNDMLRNGQTSWAAGVPVFVNVAIAGLNAGEGETVGLKAYIYNANTPAVTTPITETNEGSRRYALPTSLGKGTYYVVIAHADKEDNYTLADLRIKFAISSDPAAFTENDLVWQYSIGGGSKSVISGSHNTIGSALDLTYAADVYSFSITLDATALQKLNVRVVSYNGDTTATDYKYDAYCVSVTIAAYDATYYFPTTTYNLYYRINKAKFDLSGVKWDYYNPFTYDGEEKDVFIDGNTLPKGLSVSSYTGNTGKIDANETTRKYYTNVVFAVENQNYIVPVQTDSSTYQGKFSWTCEWVINKASIDVKWKPTVQIDENNKIFNIPVLIDGAEKVTYTFEKWIIDTSYDEGGRWSAVTKPEYSPTEVKYRVLPKLTDGSFNTVNYDANYKLVPFDDEDTLWHEFIVGGDQIPVMIYLLIYNGDEVNSGKAQTVFYYNGKPYAATWAKDDEEGRIVISSATYTYTTLDDDGTTLGISTTAPTNVGKYKVTANVEYTIKEYGDSSVFKSTIEHTYEIQKGTIDISSLVWELDHNGKYTYDAAQGKWLDQYKAEVGEFVYDGKPYTITLKGQDSLTGIVDFSSFTNEVGTAAGNYTTRFVMRIYEESNWNPIGFDNFFTWTISKAKITLDKASWNYTSPFTYGFDENGDVIARTVELQDLPDELIAMVATGAANIKYTGNYGTNAGDYVARVTITTTDVNYEVVFPEVLSDTINWNIAKRVLALPEQNGKWTTFDGKSHDLLTETCGADADWADFYDVTVRYSNDGITYANYTGYDGVVTDGYHACYYQLDLKIKDTVNTRNNENAVWESQSATNQTVKIKVDKLVVTVTGWDGDNEESVVMTDYDAIVKPAGLITYSFVDENGVEYKTEAQIEQLKQLGGGIKVTVTPAVKAAATGFTEDITLAFIDENSKTYSYITPYRGIEWLAYPTLTETTVTYDGKAHTFTVKDWENYADYIELTSTSDALTQTKAGTYVAEFQIKSGAQASWQTSDGSIDLTSTVSLTFYIQTRTIDIPSLKDYTFTGSSINAVENLSADIMDYVTCTSVTGTNAGRYSAVFSLIDSDSCIWSDTTTDSKTIVWNITQKTLPTPEVSGWTVFDGSVHNIVKDCGYDDDWNNFFDISVKYSVDGTDFNAFEGFETGKKYTAYAPGVYEITFKINSGLNTSSNENVIWSNSSTDDITVSLAVSKLRVTVTGWNANREQSTVKLADGTAASDKFFEYIIKDSETNAIVTEADVLTAGVGKGFTIELAVKTGFEDYIEILYKNDSFRTYFFSTEKISITKPVLRFNSATFDGTPKTFEIVDWNTKYSKYLEMDKSVSYLTQTDAATYEIVLSFKANSVAKWSDDSTDAVRLEFKILELDIDKPVITDMPYTGSEIDVISSYLATKSKFVEVVSGGKATNAGTNTVELALKYPSSTKWSGGDSQNLTLTWTITQNKLTEPSNSGRWTQFDAANHNLLDLCGVQADWSNYYDVSIEYAADGVAYGDFTGTVAYNAGSYKLTFKIKSALNSDADNVVWSVSGTTADVVVTVEVEKLSVTVIGWNENKNYSTVKLASGTIPSSVMSYRFTNEAGHEVTESEVLAAAGGVKFSKQLIISDTDNVVVTYDSPEFSKYTFVMLVHEMDTPVIQGSSSIVYDGKSHTFIIEDWDLYSDYVEIVRSVSDNLAQQDAGSYSVTLHIKDTLISTWKDGTTADVTLNFEITQLVVDGIWDTTSIPNVFKVTGTYPVDNLSLVTTTYTDKDGNVAYTFVEGETYTATVAIARSYQTNYVLDSDIPLSQTFEQPIQYAKIDLPTFAKGVDTLPYNGQAQTFQISRQSFYEQYMDISGSLTQTDAGTYTVTLTFKEGAHATWLDDSTDAVTLTFRITAITVNAVWDTGTNKITVAVPVLDTAGTEYAGGSLPADLIAYTFTDESGAVVTETDLKASSKWNNNYYVSAAISKNHSKNFAFASDVQKVFAFFIDSEGNITTKALKQLDKPVLVNDKLVYNGKEQTFTIKNWAQYSDYLTITDGSLSQTNAAEYTVTLSFKPNAFAIWKDGGIDDVTLKFNITPKVLSGNWVLDDKEETQPYVEINGTDDEKALAVYAIVDADGNEVTNVLVNKTYYITVSLTNSNYALSDELEKTIAFMMNSDGSLTEIIVKKLDFPAFVQDSFIYDGTAHTFELVGYDDVKDFITITGDSLTQAAVGDYEITVSITDPTLATWNNGTTGDVSISFHITARSTALEIEAPSFVEDTLVYTGSELTFEIADWAEKYDGKLSLSGDGLSQTDADTYTVIVHIIDTSLFIWADGSVDDITLTFEIVKAKVEGEWKLGDEVPYFAPDESVFGAYPEDMIEYVITDKDGTVLEFKDTETCVTYYMTATIVNGNFEFAESVQTTFAFRYTEGNVLFAVEVQKLELPEFVESAIEFDGEEHTFEIKNWEYLGQYLEISGASLTQTKVGEYSVTFTIVDTTLATWTNGTTRTFSLKFEITERTSGTTELELPELIKSEYTYDGTAHVFEIEGWADLADKVVLDGDGLTQTEVGDYTAVLRIKNSVLYVWADGSDTVKVTFSVSAILLNTVWVTEDTEVPYLADVSSDIVRYEVTDLNGNVVDAYNAVAGENYYITAYITDYNYKFENGLETRFVYRLSSDGTIVPVENTVIDGVEFVEPEIEYDGEEHTFVIKNWEFLSRYLEMSGASLTQTNVGKYSVTFTITDPTLAAWASGSARPLTVRFEITERTSGVTELEIPVIETAEYTYDGTAHTFVLEGWADLADKVELLGDGLTQTDVGTYTVTLRIKNSVLYVWANGGDTVKVSFKIKAFALKAEWVYDNTDVPYISFTTTTARRAAALNADVRSDMVRYEITDYEGNIIDPNKQVSGVNYYINAIITDPNYSFEEGFETRFVYRISADGEIVPVEKTTIDEVKFVVDAIKYDGDAHTFVIADWDKLEPYIQIIGSLTRTAVGDYRVTVHIIDKTLATWSNGTALDRSLSFRITKEDETVKQMKFERPVISNKVQNYDGSSKTFTITNWSVLQNYVEILEGVNELTQTETGTYTVTLHIIDPVNVQWEDGSVEDITLIFKVDKFVLEGAWNAIGKIPAIDFNEKEYLLTLPENLIQSVITDRTGAAVLPDELEKGETYLITYTVNEEYADRYFLPTALRSSYFKVSDSVSERVDGFPAEDAENDNTLTKVVIAVVIILVLFLITIIICFVYIIVARKKKAKQDAEDAEQSDGASEDENLEDELLEEAADYPEAEAEQTEDNFDAESEETEVTAEEETTQINEE